MSSCPLYDFQPASISKVKKDFAQEDVLINIAHNFKIKQKNKENAKPVM